MRVRECLTTVFVVLLTASIAADQKDVLGRWNLTTTGESPGSYEDNVWAETVRPFSARKVTARS